MVARQPIYPGNQVLKRSKSANIGLKTQFKHKLYKMFRIYKLIYINISLPTVARQPIARATSSKIH